MTEGNDPDGPPRVLAALLLPELHRSRWCGALGPHGAALLVDGGRLDLARHVLRQQRQVRA